MLELGTEISLHLALLSGQFPQLPPQDLTGLASHQ